MYDTNRPTTAAEGNAMTITHDHAGKATENGTDGPLTALWVELGLECQLRCVHCFAGAAPGKGFGTMTPDDWERVIGEAAALGCRHVTFIGGEPTLSPTLGRLVRFALDLGLHAEVYSNLVHVSPDLWELFGLRGVTLAVSWYTSDRQEHAAITGRDTWRQTRANIAEAVRRSIPVRAGMVDGIVPGQQTEDGERELRALGVSEVGIDRVREFGRGTIAAPDQACGRCGHGCAAVLLDGTVTPCPMTRWMTAGSVHHTGLGAILESVASMAAGLPVRGSRACNPDDCRPDVYCPPLCAPSVCRPHI
jgi:sulfatase maturation enzyme AslB (radical SAM superfamily)